MKEKEKSFSTEEKIKELSKNLDIIYKFCQRYGEYYGKSYDSYEDFVSQCKVIAYETIDKWDNTRSALTTFLYNVLPYKLKKAYKTNSRKVDTVLFSDIEDEEDNVEEGFKWEGGEINEQFKLIEDFLDEMTKEYYLEGYSYKQIADKYNCCPRTVKNRIRENIQNIREKIFLEK